MGRIRGSARLLSWERARGDVAVVEGARAALDAAFGRAAEEVSLRVHQGVLTIRGEVDRLDEIGEFDAAVRQVPGVLDVDNLLRLRLAGRVRPHVVHA